MKTINGIEFRNMLKGGRGCLFQHKEEVDKLNVFPIPDGDTGDNMLLTISGGLVETAESLSDFTEKMASGMLLSARGNSGVILSRFFKGLAEGLKNKDSADCEEFSNAMKIGTEMAYSAVYSPKEGTILTVMHDISKKAVEISTNGVDDFEEFFTLIIEEGNQSVDRTPDLLNVLKEAEVVDSGGKGFVYILEGMYSSMTGVQYDDIKEETSKNTTVNADAFKEDTPFEYGYCTELLVRLRTEKCDIDSFDINALRLNLDDLGNSIVCIKEGSIVKIHIHTFIPQRVMDLCQSFGEFLAVKIENMMLQHNEIINEEKADVEQKHKELAYVTVADGDGIKEYFNNIGVDIVIEGGQTNNPSGNDFIAALNKANADKIIVFPTNPNIVLAAEQAVEIFNKNGKGQARVAASKYLADVVSSILMAGGYDGMDIDDIVDDLNDNMDGAITLETAETTRDATIYGISVKKGEFLTLRNGKPISCGETPFASLLKAFNKIEDELCGGTVFWKSDDDATQLMQNKDKLNLPDDAQIIKGGQHVYDYMTILF